MQVQLSKKNIAIKKKYPIIDCYVRMATLSSRFSEERFRISADIYSAQGISKLAELKAWEELLTIARTFTIAGDNGGLDKFGYSVRFRALGVLMNHPPARDRAAPLLADLIARFLHERKAQLHKENNAAFGIHLLIACERYVELAGIRDALIAAREPVIPHSSCAWQWLVEGIDTALRLTDEAEKRAGRQEQMCGES